MTVFGLHVYPGGAHQEIVYPCWDGAAAPLPSIVLISSPTLPFLVHSLNQNLYPF